MDKINRASRPAFEAWQELRKSVQPPAKHVLSSVHLAHKVFVKGSPSPMEKKRSCMHASGWNCWRSPPAAGSWRPAPAADTRRLAPKKAKERRWRSTNLFATRTPQSTYAPSPPTTGSNLMARRTKRLSAGNAWVRRRAGRRWECRFASPTWWRPAPPWLNLPPSWRKLRPPIAWGEDLFHKAQPAKSKRLHADVWPASSWEGIVPVSFAAALNFWVVLLSFFCILWCVFQYVLLPFCWPLVCVF